MDHFWVSEYQTTKRMLFKWFNYSHVKYSDSHCIWNDVSYPTMTCRPFRFLRPWPDLRCRCSEARRSTCSCASWPACHRSQGSGFCCHPKEFFYNNGIRWLLFSYLHHNSQSFVIIFVHWTKLLDYWSNDTNYIYEFYCGSNCTIPQAGIDPPR